jgi:hypothetical protein
LIGKLGEEGKPLLIYFNQPILGTEQNLISRSIIYKCSCLKKSDFSGRHWLGRMNKIYSKKTPAAVYAPAGVLGLAIIQRISNRHPALLGVYIHSQHL